MAQKSPTIVDFDHHSPDFAQRNREMAREFLTECPVARTDAYGGFWVVSRYADVLSVLRDTEMFSSGHDHGNGPREGGVIPGGKVGLSGGFAEMDGHEHARLRTALNPYFSTKAVAALKPDIVKSATWLVDQVIERGVADFIHDIAAPIPGIVTLRMLGIPVDRFENFSLPIHLSVAVPPTDPDRPRVNAMLKELLLEMRDWCERKRADPGDDMLSFLATHEFDGELLDMEELTAEAVLLLAGGIDTSLRWFANTFLHLSTHPEDRDWLIANPDKRALAREEFLRYYTPATGKARTAMHDGLIGDQPVKAGDRVYAWFQPANHDPAVFADPERFDMQRAKNLHVSFGFGVHRCIGARLAQVEWDVVFDEILARMPDFQVRLDETVRYASVGQGPGYTAMPFDFTPGPRIGPAEL
jgi:cytochrome P450